MIVGSNSINIYIPKTKAQKLSFWEQTFSNTGSLEWEEPASDNESSDSQYQIISSYIAPERNKHIFGLFSHNKDNSFYFGPNYSYGSDAITEEQQVVIIDSGGDSCDCDLYWKDIGFI